MAKRRINLQFPQGGVHKAAGYQGQPPYTSPSAENVRSYDVYEGRARGGSRPGLGLAFCGDVVPLIYGARTGPVYMLSSIAVSQEAVADYWQDTFNGDALGGAWTVLPTNGETFTAPDVWPDGFASCTASHAGDSGCYGVALDALTDFAHSGAYTVSIWVAPWNGAHHGEYFIFAGMDDTTPDPYEDGIVAYLAIAPDHTLSGWVKWYSGGVLQDTDNWTSDLTWDYPVAGQFRLEISAAGAIDAFFLDKEISGAIAGYTATGSGKTRIGFGMNMTGAAGNRTLVDTFRVNYLRNDKHTLVRDYLIASAAGRIFLENEHGVINISESRLGISSGHHSEAVPYQQKLYIADYGYLCGGTTGEVDGAGDFRDDVVTPNEWNGDWGLTDTYKEDKILNNFLLTLTYGTSSYTCTLEGLTSLTKLAVLRTDTGVKPPEHEDPDFYTWRIDRCPKYFDMSEPGELLDLSQWKGTQDTGGIAPIGCPVIASYRDRMFLAGADAAPHLWYLSRQGNPLDWNYGASAWDIGRAVAGQNCDAGQLGEPITAAIPYHGDYLVIGCAKSTWVMRGDPAAGGILDNLSRHAGILSPGAWCMTDRDEIIFLGPEGLHIIPPGAIAVQSLNDNLPLDLQNVDARTHTVLLEYDLHGKGVHIFLTGNEKASRTHWWWSQRENSLWRVSTAEDYEPLSLARYHAGALGDSGVILGCRDGYLRQFRDVHLTDQDGTSRTSHVFGSHVLYGPFRLGPQGIEGLLIELEAALSDRSGTLWWKLYVDDTAEGATALAVAATANTEAASGSWTEGTNYTARPRRRGQAAVLRVYCAAGRSNPRAWAVENIYAGLKPAGRFRKPGSG